MPEWENAHIEITIPTCQTRSSGGIYFISLCSPIQPLKTFFSQTVEKGFKVLFAEMGKIKELLGLKYLKKASKINKESCL